MASPLLELSALTCQRGRRTLFSGLSETVRGGQLLRVEGANGAGKTSLLRMICGLVPPSEGDVRWGGQSVAKLRDEFNRELLYIGHGAALKDDLSAAENLLFGMRLGGQSASPDEVRQALGAAGLSTRQAAAVRLLSQGQRRRAVLARLTLSKTRSLWMLDEPFNALDQVGVAWLTGVLEAHLQQGGLVVLTTHQGQQVGAMASTLVIRL